LSQDIVGEPPARQVFESEVDYCVSLILARVSTDTGPLLLIADWQAPENELVPRVISDN
jgi:hypothetical protein